MFALAATDIDWFLNLQSAPGGPKANFWTPTPWSIRRLKPGHRLYFLLKSLIRKIGGWGAFCRYIDMTIERGWADEVGSSTQWNSASAASEFVDRGDKDEWTRSHADVRRLGAALLCGWRRGKEEAAVLVALALLARKQPATAATHRSATYARLLHLASWLKRRPTRSRTAGAPTPPRMTIKTKQEKAGVPATVVDGEQLESVLGIEALSSTGENMGRIVDIIVDRSGQIRAAIIDFGGFLGVGSRKIAVDWRSLHFDPKKAGLVVVESDEGSIAGRASL